MGADFLDGGDVSILIPAEYSSTDLYERKCSTDQ